ncbi:unnamed protein product [Litomosoides sigmodontis]|uniref:Phosphomannomutase n=1 Tax=Litomosoides sigmodontis TaxID=42156 RepID=A0A3P6UPX8_LITSI|nr:unnamed protein product [Litomosoides sigmodontis]
MFHVFRVDEVISVNFPFLLVVLQKMDRAMINFLTEVHKAVPLAVVSGSDLPKIIEQLGESLEDVLSRFDYVFSENGLVSVSKRTTFPVQGMLNLSPIGRCCTQEERLQFVAYDKEYGVRQKFVKKLQDFTEGWGLNICIGGQISIDVFPCGWDKTYCLQFLNDFRTVYFFGDRTAPGGNDYDLFVHPRTTAYTVKDPEDTKKQVSKLLETL